MSSHSENYYRRCAKGYTPQGKHAKPESIRRQQFSNYSCYYQPPKNDRLQSQFHHSRQRGELFMPFTQQEAMSLFLSGMLIIRIGEILSRR